MHLDGNRQGADSFPVGIGNLTWGRNLDVFATQRRYSRVGDVCPGINPREDLQQGRLADFSEPGQIKLTITDICGWTDPHTAAVAGTIAHGYQDPRSFVDRAVDRDRVGPGGKRAKFGKHRRDVSGRSPGPADGVSSLVDIGIKSGGEHTEVPPRGAICRGDPGDVNGDYGH